VLLRRKNMMKKINVSTSRKCEFVDITSQVQDAVMTMGLADGVITVFIPHTTGGVTINENCDPDVLADMEQALDAAVPWSAGYAHGEGNAAAHVKASMMGSSAQVIVEAGRLQLGTWQGIFFCEFDGPRSRKVWVSAQ
jgi:secondary thiamine-phosphate synthase enzyme